MFGGGLWNPQPEHLKNPDKKLTMLLPNGKKLYLTRYLKRSFRVEFKA